MRRPEGAKPDINVTPLVDVVLVLLIIFMVIVPQMEAGASVSLPGVRNPDPASNVTQTPVTLSITSKGGLFLEKQPVQREVLVSHLRRARAVAPTTRLVIKADKDVPYGVVRDIFKECQEIGFLGVSLQVGDRREGEKK